MAGIDYTIENNIIKGSKNPSLKYKGRKDVGKILLDNFNAAPEFVALINADTGVRSTFANIRDRSLQVASWLSRELDIKPGDIIGIADPQIEDSYSLFFATFFLGAVLTGYNHEAARPVLEHVIRLTEPKVIFASSKSVELIEDVAKSVGLKPRILVFGPRQGHWDSFDEVILKSSPGNFVPRQVEANDPCMILYTSGTTGMPKAVTYSYDGLLTWISSSCSVPDDQENWLFYSPLFYNTGYKFTLKHVILRKTRIYARYTNRLEDVLKTIDKYKVGWMYLPTVILGVIDLSVSGKYDGTSMKFATVRAGRPSQNLLAEWKKCLPNIKFMIAIGTTEAGHHIVQQTLNCKSPRSVGYPTENVEAKIVDLKTGEPLGPNESGGFYYRYPGLVRLGYYKNPEATKDLIDDEGWLKSGDLAYYDENGEMFIENRLSEKVERRGETVYVGKTERLLEEHPDVYEAIIVPRPHAGEEVPVGYVTKRPGSKVTEAELIEMSGTLGPLRKLWKVTFLEKLPRTDVNKVNRRALTQMAKSMTFD